MFNYWNDNQLITWCKITNYLYGVEIVSNYWHGVEILTNYWHGLEITTNCWQRVQTITNYWQTTILCWGMQAAAVVEQVWGQRDSRACTPLTAVELTHQLAKVIRGRGWGASTLWTTVEATTPIMGKLVSISMARCNNGGAIKASMVLATATEWEITWQQPLTNNRSNRKRLLLRGRSRPVLVKTRMWKNPRVVNSALERRNKLEIQLLWLIALFHLAFQE